MTQRSAERMRSFCAQASRIACKYCLKHGIEYIIVESGDRFARNLVVQETGLEWLGSWGWRSSAQRMRPNYPSPLQYN